MLKYLRGKKTWSNDVFIANNCMKTSLVNIIRSEIAILLSEENLKNQVNL